MLRFKKHGKPAILIFLIVFSILASLALIPLVSAPEVSIESANTNTIDNTEPHFMRSSFNTWNRSWVFLCIMRDYPPEPPFNNAEILTYSTSTDEITWLNSWDDFGETPLITSGADSWEFDIHFDGTYVHYVRDYGRYIYYRRGTPLSNGSITWGNQQTAYYDTGGTYWNVAYPKVCADSDHYVWIGWERLYAYFPQYNVTNMVTKSSTNDGTWSTAAGFPYQLTGWTNGSGNAPTACAIPLCMDLSGATGNSDTYVLYADSINDDLKGKFYDGSWGNEETITNTLGGYFYPSLSAIAGYSAIWVAWQNQSMDLLFRERNYATLWQDVELIADATTEEIYNASTPYPTAVIGIDGNLTIHAFWIGTRDYSLGLGYKNRTVTPSVQWNDFELLTTTSGARDWLQCREKAFEGIMACEFKEWSSGFPIHQWSLDWDVTDYSDYSPSNFVVGAHIRVNLIYDDTGLNFTIGGVPYIEGQWSNFDAGTYEINATSYFLEPETYHFVEWATSTHENIVFDNSSAPTTNVTVSGSGNIILDLETSGWHVDTYIRFNGQEPYANMTFTIDSTEYANGQYAILLSGDYAINGTLPFIEYNADFVSWSVTGNVDVENLTDSTTTLTVSGGNTSSLTLNVDIPCVNVLVLVDGQPAPHAWDQVSINGGRYRSGDLIQLANGTYDLTANLAARYGFQNWSISAASGESWFGNQSIGGYNTTTPMNQKTAAYGTSYYLDRRASVTKIWLYCWASADVQKGTCGIYSIEGFDIQNAVLMGETEELTGINVTAMWRNFTFTPALTLEAGSYALTIHAGNISAGLRGKYDAETGSHFQGNVPDTYADGLSNPFGAGGSNISNCYVSIYAEYTYDLLQVGNNTEPITTLRTYTLGVEQATLTLNLYTLPDMMNLYTWIVLLIVALFLMVWSPSWFAWKVKKVGITPDSIERLGYAMLLFIVGFGLLVMCLFM